MPVFPLVWLVKCACVSLYAGRCYWLACFRLPSTYLVSVRRVPLCNVAEVHKGSAERKRGRACWFGLVWFTHLLLLRLAGWRAVWAASPQRHAWLFATCILLFLLWLCACQQPCCSANPLHLLASRASSAVCCWCYVAWLAWMWQFNTAAYCIALTPWFLTACYSVPCDAYDCALGLAHSLLCPEISACVLRVEECILIRDTAEKQY
jgi:hypothetical protein